MVATCGPRALRRGASGRSFAQFAPRSRFAPRRRCAHGRAERSRRRSSRSWPRRRCERPRRCPGEAGRQRRGWLRSSRARRSRWRRRSSTNDGARLGRPAGGRGGGIEQLDQRLATAEPRAGCRRGRGIGRSRGQRTRGQVEAGGAGEPGEPGTPRDGQEARRALHAAHARSSTGRVSMFRCGRTCRAHTRAVMLGRCQPPPMAGSASDLTSWSGASRAAGWRRCSSPSSAGSRGSTGGSRSSGSCHTWRTPRTSCGCSSRRRSSRPS